MSRAWALLARVLVGTVACRPAPPERLTAPRPEPRTTELPAEVAEEAASDGPRARDIRASMTAMPAFDWRPLIPDPTAEALRWPLAHSHHPELAPQFEIARALAEPGLDWIALCRMGAHRRLAGNRLRDELSYLRAWCAVGQRDVDRALAELAPLRGSVVRGLGAAIPADIANIAVSHGDARHATALLTKHRLTDPALLDVVAATYLDLGKVADGRELNALALGHDGRTVPADHCRRLARKIVLDPASYRRPRLDGQTLFGFETEDPTCRRLEAELDCWLAPKRRCKAYFANAGIHAGVASLILAADAWQTAHSTEGWRTVVDHAIDGAPFPLALELAVAAIENLSARTGCELDRAEFRLLGRSLRSAAVDPLPKELEERLDWVEKYPPPYCK